MAARVNERPHLHDSRPVRRVLFYVFVVATIYLGPPLPMASSNLPADNEGAPLNVCCSVLLRMGFTEPACYQTAGELLPHRFTLTALCSGLFSVALARESPRVAVSHHPALWSPDVPRDKSRAAAQPTDMHREF